MQHIFHAAMDDCVPGIIAALAADNYVRSRSKHVDNLAFALVAPLHSDQNSVCHVKSKMGKKFSRRIRAGHSRDLPTDNKLTASPRNRFYACFAAALRALGTGTLTAPVDSLSSRGRRARRLSSGFHHCGPNRAHSLDVYSS